MAALKQMITKKEGKDFSTSINEDLNKLTLDEISKEKLSLDKLTKDLEILNGLVNWKSSRSSCSCLHLFDYVLTKLNCSKCGIIYCDHCVELSKYNLNKLIGNNNDSLATQITNDTNKFICQKCDSTK